MRLAIHGRGFSAKTEPYIRQVLDIIRSKGSELLLSDEFVAQNLSSGINFSDYPTFTKYDSSPDVDAFISLGGDGTLLETLLYVKERETPIMGINTGRLGFMATIAKQDIEEAFECLYNDDSLTTFFGTVPAL